MTISYVNQAPRDHKKRAAGSVSPALERFLVFPECICEFSEYAEWSSFHAAQFTLVPSLCESDPRSRLRDTSSPGNALPDGRDSRPVRVIRPRFPAIVTGVVCVGLWSPK
jgi:hypothetical protein